MRRFLGRLGDGHLAGDAARGQGVDAVADAEQLRQLGGDDDDRLALGGQLG